MADFKDHFSRQSAAYRRFRPTYPPALFAYLAELPARRQLAWDCACGTGQAARHLAGYFHKVLATDASAAQIRNAEGPANVDFCVAPAERSGLKPGSIDLLTVAQALHWFDLERFYAEAQRVLKPSGVIAVWSYGLLSVSPELDPLIGALYEDILGPFWPPERRLVEEGYQSLAFPFEEEAAVPSFAMQTRWKFDQLMGYFSSWSAVQNYQTDRGQSPLEPLRGRLQEAWGDPAMPKQISWPLKLRVGRPAGG